MQDTVVIPSRFRGPPQSGNGGYVSGAFAELLPTQPGLAPEITLRSPIPLDRTMTVKRGASETRGVDVFDNETLIAECRLIDSPFVDFTVPPCPDPARIEAAMPSSLAFTPNINPLLPNQKGFHPICFCCGVEAEDGLHVYPAPLDQGHVAALWKTEEAWAIDGKVPASFLWTAMDCPAQFAFMNASIRTGLMGRMSAEILALPAAGATLIVSAWTIAVQGKKHFAGAALFDETGEQLARATTLWIGGEPI